MFWPLAYLLKLRLIQKSAWTDRQTDWVIPIYNSNFSIIMFSIVFNPSYVVVSYRKCKHNFYRQHSDMDQDASLTNGRLCRIISESISYRTTTDKVSQPFIILVLQGHIYKRLTALGCNKRVIFHTLTYYDN